MILFSRMRRRFFLRTSASASIMAGSTQSLLALAGDNVYRKNIGLQIYTLRDQLKVDLKGTLKAVADAGYQQVEPYGFPGGQEMVKVAKDLGLDVHSIHFDWEAAVNPTDEGFSDFKKIIDKAKGAGLSHLVVPYLHDKDRKTLDDYKRVAGNLNKAAVIAKEAEIQLAYHNHSFEFQPMEESTGYDIFVQEFGDEMMFEVDVFWVRAADLDPVSLIKGLSGRISQLHLKDIKKGLKLPMYGGLPKEAFKELGNGIIPMEPIIEAAKAAGVVHCHVEQDQSPDPIASIKESVAYLKAL
jgi:sugar phosphate isomerase/epimerase